MSEKNNIFENDLLMRTILEGGQEEVPAHVWDAVSARLDKADKITSSKAVTLWWRRAGVAVAAVAAAIAAVLMVGREEVVDIVPVSVQEDMIAVAEPEVIMNEEAGFETVVSQTSGARLLAYVPQTSSADASAKSETAISPSNSSIPDTDEVKDVVTENKEAWTYTDWEEETPTRKVNTSIVVSGLTGASSSANDTGNGSLKAPSVVLAPTKTGIKEKENQTKYGIPVSVGAGVRFEFTPKWSLGVGLNYTNLTRTFTGTYTHVNEAGSIDNLITSDIKNTQHYLGIPVNAYYNILNNDIVNFYTYAGGTVEKCVYDKYLVLTNNIVHKEPAKGVQLSANIGLGAEFMLGQHTGLYIDPSLRYYFDCDQPKSIRTAQPLTFGVEVGLRFKL